MITGSVFNRQPTVSLTVYDQNGQEHDVEAVVDTGFSGYLTLPYRVIALLGLPFAHYYVAGLADGSLSRMEVYTATALWDDAELSIDVLATNGEVLLGTSLMDGFDLNIQFADSGLVTLERL